jgi:hypothetical protein
MGWRAPRFLKFVIAAKLNTPHDGFGAPIPVPATDLLMRWSPEDLLEAIKL